MWLKLTDGYDTTPRILHAARSEAEVDRIVGMLVRLSLYCARQRTDGFVPALVVRQRIRSARLLRAFTDPEDGADPLLHPRGTTCECMRGLKWPATAGDYYVHGYLDSNPFAAEYDLAAQQRAELRDRELREAVRRRDRDRCRYCGIFTVAADRRSRAGRVFDHVDPGQAAGAANLVVACRECNSRKGKRTPAAAGMTLLPAPVAGQSFPAPAGPVADDVDDLDVDDLAQTYDEPDDSDPSTTWRADTDGPGRDGTGRVHDPARPPPNDAGWAGPAGHRHPHPRPPARHSSARPNLYLRSAITGPDPDDHAGLPDTDDTGGRSP